MNTIKQPCQVMRRGFKQRCCAVRYRDKPTGQLSRWLWTDPVLPSFSFTVLKGNCSSSWWWNILRLGRIDCSPGCVPTLHSWKWAVLQCFISMSPWVWSTEWAALKHELRMECGQNPRGDVLSWLSRILDEGGQNVLLSQKEWHIYRRCQHFHFPTRD